MLRRLLAFVILLGLLGGGLYYWKYAPGQAPPELGQVGRRLDDARLHASVKAAFELNRHLRALDVQIQSEDGVVTLRGDVPDAQTRALAEQVARAVPGVRQVVTHLRLDARAAAQPDAGAARTLGESLDDHALEVKVRLALSLQRDLEGARVEAAVWQREVTLTGELRSEAQRGLALSTARDVPDVTGVVDRLRVSGAPAGDRRAAVERALASNPSLSRYAIRVREERGQFVLAGRVATGAEKELAGLLARDAAGAAVVNALETGSRGPEN